MVATRSGFSSVLNTLAGLFPTPRLDYFDSLVLSGEERDLTPVPLSPSLSPAPSPLDVSQGVVDKYRMFKSHMFHVKGEAWAELSRNRQLCLGAQTSLDR